MFCEAVFGLCDSPAPMPFNFTFPRPAPSHPKFFPTSGLKPFQVIHFSDVHIDRQYTVGILQHSNYQKLILISKVGANANCTKNICCRDFPDSPPPDQITDPAQPFGNSRCDSPPNLAQSMLDSLKANIPHSEFAVFTGDVVEGTLYHASSGSTS